MESEKELFQHYRFVADKGQDPLRVDKFLINFIENASRSKIQQSARDGYIHVNGLPVKANYKVKSGDVVTVEYKNPPRNHELIPQDIPINIMYEDDDILIVNKDAGM
ncbi:MAG: RNA pseudouridine synthase, partial [Flavobacteriales bacterium]|nr:RNA pseudouridine synthase [Flavobacteriales bacterium]